MGYGLGVDLGTTYTAAAVILAADALGETYGHSTPGSGFVALPTDETYATLTGNGCERGRCTPAD